MLKMTLANIYSGVKAQEFANETKMIHIFNEYFENIIDWYGQTVKEKEFIKFLLNTN